MKQLNVWRRNDPGCEIELVITSPGGSVISGMALYDYIQTLRREGHKVTTIALGMAASMGGILLQAGDVRAMGKEAVILIHEISTVAWGKATDLIDELSLVNIFQNRILDIFAERAAEAGVNGTASDPMTRKEFAKKWNRTDWWVDSASALKWGIVDKLV